MIPTVIRKVYWKLRKMVFTRPRPANEYFIVDATEERLNRLFGQYGFGPNWALSYKFRGENINLARQYYQETSYFPDIVWWQIHIRGWIRDDGKFEIHAHTEAEPTEHPSEHLDGLGYEDEDAMDIIEKLLRKDPKITIIGKTKYE